MALIHKGPKKSGRLEGKKKDLYRKSFWQGVYLV